MARINVLDPRNSTLPSGAVRVVGGQLLEADGSAAGVYTFDVLLPAYAVLLDYVIHWEALWTAGTSTTGEVGFYEVSSGAVGDVIDADDIYSAIDMKATDMAAGEQWSFAWAGGQAGDAMGVVATQDKLVDTVDTIDRFIRFKVTTVGTVGTAGKTYAYAVYALPEMDATTFTAS
jgi:hypothetical protein